MHSLGQSRIVWLSVIAAAVAAFSGAVSTSEAGTFPVWVAPLLNAGNVALAAAVVAVRVGMDPARVEKRKAKP
jgi:hypothetical protein